METMKGSLLTGSDMDIAMKDFVDSFGGENAMKKNYPKTYEAYKQTIDGQDLLSKDASGDDVSEYCFINILHVGYLDETKKKLYVRLSTEFEEETSLNQQNIKVTNRNTSALLVNSNSKSFMGSGVEDELVVDLNNCNIDDLTITVNSYCASDSIYPYQWEGTLSGFTLEGTSGYEIIHPTIRHKNKANKDISVSFYRSAGCGFAGGDWDYWYKESWDDQFFRLENEGSITVKGLELVSLTSCVLSATNAAGTRFQHLNALTGVKLSYDPAEKASKISWTIDKNWGVKFTDLMGLYGDYYITYDLTIIAVSKNGKLKTFLVTNKKSKATAYVHKIPYVRIYTDCFAKRTLITMGDGSQKPVEELRIGDRIFSPNNQSAIVHFVESSYAIASLNLLKLENGEQLVTTKGHLIATEGGMRPASLLSRGDVILTKNRNVKVHSSEETTEYDNEIVVVGVSGNRLYANHILVGDSEAELTEKERANNIRLLVPEEWRNDYDSWMAQK